MKYALDCMLNKYGEGNCSTYQDSEPHHEFSVYNICIITVGAQGQMQVRLIYKHMKPAKLVSFGWDVDYLG